MSVVFEFWQTTLLLYPTVSSLYPTEFPKSREIPAFIFFFEPGLSVLLVLPLGSPVLCYRLLTTPDRPRLSEECWPF